MSIPGGCGGYWETLVSGTIGAGSGGGSGRGGAGRGGGGGGGGCDASAANGRPFIFPPSGKRIYIFHPLEKLNDVH